MRAHKTLQWRI